MAEEKIDPGVEAAAEKQGCRTLVAPGGKCPDCGWTAQSSDTHPVFHGGAPAAAPTAEPAPADTAATDIEVERLKAELAERDAQIERLTAALADKPVSVAETDAQGLGSAEKETDDSQ